MQFPLATIDLATPRLNKRNPHELHWREEKPKWPGNVESAFHNQYSHLQDTSCCLQCGAIPCPYDHDEERKQRLQDLAFVRELAKERKELAIELKKKEDDLAECFAQAEVWKMEKVLLKDELNHFQKLQKEWEREKVLMEAEIKRLQYLHEQDLEQIRAYNQDKKKLKALTAQLEALEKDYASISEENKKFRQMIVNQSTEINQLSLDKINLQKEADDAKAKARMLRMELAECQESLSNVETDLRNSENRIRNLEREIRDLIEDISRKTKLFQEKEKQSFELITQLKDQIQALQDAFDRSETENSALKIRIEEYLAEIERLRRRLASDRRFQQFVEVKREVNELRDINESLFDKIKENPDTVPVMKRSGRVSSARSRVASTEPVKLNRPKSSRSLRRWSEDDDF